MDEPKLHMWETGVMRITRHPQALGQALWCAAHTAWIGSSFMVATSAALMAHHVFGCWHGDFRLRRKYGAVRPRAPRHEFVASIVGCACANMWVRPRHSKVPDEISGLYGICDGTANS